MGNLILNALKKMTGNKEMGFLFKMQVKIYCDCYHDYIPCALLLSGFCFVLFFSFCSLYSLFPKKVKIVAEQLEIKEPKKQTNKQKWLKWENKGVYSTLFSERVAEMVEKGFM